MAEQQIEGDAVLVRDYRNWRDFAKACKAMDFLGLSYTVDARASVYRVTLMISDEREGTASA